MHAVSAERIGELGIVVEKTSGVGGLDQIDQPVDMMFIDCVPVTTKQDACDVRRSERLSELSFELCRWLAWKLQVEPAPRLDVSHDLGLSPPPWTLTIR